MRAWYCDSCNLPALLLYGDSKGPSRPFVGTACCNATARTKRIEKPLQAVML